MKKLSVIAFVLIQLFNINLVFSVNRGNRYIEEGAEALAEIIIPILILFLILFIFRRIKISIKERFNRMMTNANQRIEKMENDEILKKQQIVAIKELSIKNAINGDSEEQFNQGMLYRNGEGVLTDYKEAVEWLKKSADQGNKRAQFNLGLMYDQGLGTKKDHKKAIKWYNKAVENDKEAQFKLAKKYHIGEDVAQDFTEAERWFLKLAKDNHLNSQYLLGTMYFSGAGEVKKDKASARKWLKKSYENGNEEAKEFWEHHKLGHYS